MMSESPAKTVAGARKIADDRTRRRVGVLTNIAVMCEKIAPNAGDFLELFIARGEKFTGKSQIGASPCGVHIHAKLARTSYNTIDILYPPAVNAAGFDYNIRIVRGRKTGTATALAHCARAGVVAIRGRARSAAAGLEWAFRAMVARDSWAAAVPAGAGSMAAPA